MSPENQPISKTESPSTPETAVRRVSVEHDQFEPGHPGVTVTFSDGTKQWFDAREAHRQDELKNVPHDQRIRNLPPTLPEQKKG